MRKTIILSILFIASWYTLLGQENISPKEVLQRYIEAIGGSDKLESVHSIIKMETESYQGQEAKVKITTRTDGYLMMEKNAPLGKAKAVINQTEGVNIIPEGIFSIPYNQFIRYQEDARIFPELHYLKNDYPLSFNGVYNLEGKIPCYEIGVTLPDSSIIFREYNIENGLLEMTSRQKENIRIVEYKEVEGVKIPSKYKLNQAWITNDSIIINPDVEAKIFSWNTAEDLALIGRWEAVQNEREGQKQILYFEFQSNRRGQQGVGMMVDEQFKEVEFMKQPMVGWSITENNVKMQYYDPQHRKLWVNYLIIEDKNENQIIGHISDPELDKEFEGTPIKLTFNKVR